MSQFLIVTVIGDDKPGLVEQLSAAISAQGGNWLEGSMSRLAGKFAGIVKVGVTADKVASLREALGALPSLKVTAELSDECTNRSARRLTLSLVGLDRIGIVREVSQALARHAVNVEKLATHTSSAAMSAEMLFHAAAELTVAEGFDTTALQRDLERLSNDLIVDITLGESA